MKTICDFGERLRHYADSSAHRNRYPFFIPDTSTSWSVKVCPALKISRLGTHISQKFATRYYDTVSAVALFMPTELSRNFADADERYFVCDSAYCPGDSVPVGTSETDHVISVGDKAMIFSAETLGANKKVSDLSKFATLKMGDLIIFADHALDLNISEGSQLTVSLDGNESVDVKIK